MARRHMNLHSYQPGGDKLLFHGFCLAAFFGIIMRKKGAD